MNCINNKRNEKDDKSTIKLQAANLFEETPENFFINNSMLTSYLGSLVCAIGSDKPSKDHGTNYPMVDDLRDRCLLKQFLNKRVRCRGARHPPLSLVYTMSVIHMVPPKNYLEPIV